jgi:hypothetical protein
VESHWVRTGLQLYQGDLASKFPCCLPISLVVKYRCLEIECLDDSSLPEYLLCELFIVLFKDWVFRLDHLELRVKFVGSPDNGIEIEVGLAEGSHLIVA